MKWIWHLWDCACEYIQYGLKMIFPAFISDLNSVLTVLLCEWFSKRYWGHVWHSSIHCPIFLKDFTLCTSITYLLLFLKNLFYTLSLWAFSLVLCWWQCKLVQPLWHSLEVPKKVKFKLPYDRAIPLLGNQKKMLEGLL